MPETLQSDGGRNALAGFLYQIVGALGLKAVAAAHSAGGEEELDALVSVTKEARLEHEKFGQDVVLSDLLGDEGLTLVQFKFSPRSPPRPIETGEFEKIVRRLAASEEDAEREGKIVSRYYLITNRQCELKSLPVNGEPVFGTTNPAHGHPSNRRGKPSKASNAGRRAEKIRERLLVIRGVSLTSWLLNLERFARTFGCRDSEIKSGIDKLVGLVHRRTVEVGSVEIERRHLVEAFTEFAGSRPLTHEDLRPFCEKWISRFSGLVVRQGQAVRRSILDDLDREVVQNALVILEGPGGSGKSTALATWARMTQAVPPPKPGVVISVWLASRIRPSLVREEYCQMSLMGIFRRRASP